MESNVLKLTGYLTLGVAASCLSSTLLLNPMSMRYTPALISSLANLILVTISQSAATQIRTKIKSTTWYQNSQFHSSYLTTGFRAFEATAAFLMNAFLLTKVAKTALGVPLSLKQSASFALGPYAVQLISTSI